MRHFFSQFLPTPDVRANVLPAITLIVIVLLFYWASVTYPPGLLTYAISSLSLGVVGLTALARVNDITLGQRSHKWQARRLGLIMVGAACLWLVVEPLGSNYHHWPTWPEVMLRTGVALTWLTTPYMPPWWRYITGEYRDHPEFRERRDGGP